MYAALVTHQNMSCKRRWKSIVCLNRRGGLNAADYRQKESSKKNVLSFVLKVEVYAAVIIQVIMGSL